MLVVDATNRLLGSTWKCPATISDPGPDELGLELSLGQSWLSGNLETKDELT